MTNQGNQFKVILKRNQPESQEVTGEVTEFVERLLKAINGDMSRNDIQEKLSLKHEDYFRNKYLQPAINLGLVEMTIPQKPKSSKQKYRLTAKGIQYLNRHSCEGRNPED
ncbi:MAG: hypothetical protein D6B27_02765 [Gammaproteobacteria bacterium]|nr:MAG: hypothetical protein D6B27_02765 [Gammaproteobacteria bacterium]